MGYKIGQEQVDFINELKGVVDLAGRVLSFLDISSLKNAELVSKTWKKTISESRTWEKILESEMNLKPAWKQIYNRLKAEPKELPAEPKTAYFNIREKAKILEENWSKGVHNIRGKRMINENPKNSSEFMVLNEDCILIGLKSCGGIKVLNRKTLEFEKEYPKHGPGLSFLLMLDDTTLLSASRKDGVMKIWDKPSRTLLKTVAVNKAEDAVITELQTADYLVVSIVHSTSGDPWVDSKSKMIAWRAESTSKELKQVHRETFKGVSVHHLGLDAKYIVLMFLKEGRRNSFDLNLSPDIEFRSSKDFTKLFTIPHGLEEVYEFKFSRGLLAVGSRVGIRVWDVEKRTSRDLKDDRMVDGCGVSVYGFNSKFIVGHLFSGPVLVWDLETALKNPKVDSKSLLCTELKMRFDPDIRMDELEMGYLRRPHMEFMDEQMEDYDAGDHLEVILKDFLGADDDVKKVVRYEQCSESCCLSDDDDYEM